MANKTFQVQLTLTDDGRNSINFADVDEGLENPWYQFETDTSGNITLWANSEGYEYLARYFLKLSRTEKSMGFHCHHPLELGKDQDEGPELTITLCEAPSDPVEERPEVEDRS